MTVNLLAKFSPKQGQTLIEKLEAESLEHSLCNVGTFADV